MIKLNSLSKIYNRNRKNRVAAVNDITLCLPESGMVALFGRSGCGKTTLLNLIGGLDRADLGSVEINGSPVTPSSDVVRNRNIGFIFQNYYLAESLTVEENVAASLRLCGLCDEEEIKRRTHVALSSVGLERYKRRLPQTLSGGQQQRVAIARAIVKHPDIILADEPTGNLDEANTVMVMDMLKQISKNTLVILVTHEEHLVDLYCDKTIEMLDGKIISERENSDTTGYIGISKNDVYLGDMTRSDTDSEALSFCMYSRENTEKLSLSIINTGGVFYIRCDTPGAKLKLLDETAELKVHEGSFEESVRKKNEQNETKLADVLALPNVTEGKVGRMFKTGSGVKSALRRYFNKKKKMRAALIGTMFLMSTVFVFIVANSLSVLDILNEIRANYDENLIYVPISQVNESTLEDIRKESKLVYASPDFMQAQYSFNASFNGGISSKSGCVHSMRNSMFFEAVILPASFAKEASLVCGKNAIDGNGIVITTKVADSILMESNLSFIKEYEDLVGLTVTENRGLFKGDKLRIVGIVRGSQKEIYVGDVRFASALINNEAIGAQSISLPEVNIEKGTVYLSTAYMAQYKVGSKVTVNGESFVVSGYFKSNGYVDGGKIEESYDKERYSEEVEADVVIKPNSDSFLCAVMNDEDYIAVSQKSGESDFDMNYAFVKNTMYAIYPNNYSEMKTLLPSLGVSDIMDREVMFDAYYESYDVALQVSSYILTLVVISVFIAMCMFFIMRSSMTSDVKEIGIYRAVGVSRRNIVFKYFVESNVVFFLTTFVGYAVTTGVITWANSSAPITNSLIFMPWYMALATGVFLYLVSVFFGILPVVTLTKKTPAAIIAKYDI